MDPYRELGLSPEAASEPELVRAAFKALAKKYHPDGHADPAAKARAEEKMAKLNEAQRLILSGEYRPPVSFSDETAPTAPAQPVTPPPAAPRPAPPRSLRRVPIGPMVAAALCLLLGLLAPSLLQRSHLQRAIELEKEGQYQAALEQVSESIRNDARHGEAYLLRARLWQKLGHPDRASVDLANAKSLVSPSAYQTASDLLSPSPSPSASATSTPKGGG